MGISISEGTIDEAVDLELEIPEFIHKYMHTDYEKRLAENKHLILIARVNGVPVGFKIGYEREKDKSLYTWIGGVLPKYRRKGIANKLAQEQEKWAKKQGYNKVKLKTRNRFKNMLIFALISGFEIIRVEENHEINEKEIFLEKELK